MDMNNFDQNRLDLLFQMESIKAPLMNYIHPGVNLKVVTDLGWKDSDGNKRRFYEETLYPSGKYKNVDTLISANFRLNSYLLFEYPNPDYDKDSNTMRNNSIIIRAFAIDDMSYKMREFNNKIAECYKIKNNELCILGDKIFTTTVYPNFNTSISFTPDIYENAFNGNNRKEIGVRMIFNDEYSFVMSAETTWPEMVYRISHCDLTLLSFQMIQSYMALLPGMAISEIGGSYKSTDRYRPYYEDPDDIIDSQMSLSKDSNIFKPLSKKNGKSFFDK